MSRTVTGGRPRLLPSRLTRRLAFLGAVSLVFALVLVYPFVRILSLFELATPPLVAVALFSLPFLTRWLTETLHTGWSRQAAAAVMTYIGASFVAFSLLLPAELVLLAATVDPATVGSLVVLLSAALSGYGIVNATRFRVRTLDVNAAAHVRGTRLAQVSDVHIGSRHPRLLRRTVDRVNALQPDCVLITGDLVDMRNIGVDDLAPLQSIAAPSYFCIGNHERYVDLEHICERLRSLGVVVLRNASAVAGGLQIIGIDDAEARDQVAKHLPRLPAEPGKYRVLLYHRPDGMADAAAWGAHLMLTGHTHRGQIFPFYYLVKRVFPNIYGRYETAGLTLYVSPGTGTWGPVMRLGSRCEITLIRLL